MVPLILGTLNPANPYITLYILYIAMTPKMVPLILGDPKPCKSVYNPVYEYL